MDTFQTVRRLVAQRFFVNEREISRESTLGELRAKSGRTPPSSPIQGVSDDSLDQIELIMGIEEELDLDIPETAEADITNLLKNDATTLHEIVTILERYRRD